MSNRRVSLADLARQTAPPADEIPLSPPQTDDTTQGSPAAAAGQHLTVVDELPTAGDDVPASTRPTRRGQDDHDGLAGERSTPVTQSRRAARRTSPTPAAARKTSADAPAEAVVAKTHYLEYDRKEIRLRGDQFSALTALSRQLNRSRAGQGERLTENTLIRVAIDLLLEQNDQLEGADEQQLRQSVGLS